MEFGAVRHGFPISDNRVGCVEFRVQLLLVAKTKLDKDPTITFTYEGETLSLDGMPIARCFWVASRPG